jgi:hypothetical protein
MKLGVAIPVIDAVVGPFGGDDIGIKKQVRAKRERGMSLTPFARHERLRARLALLDLSGAAERAAGPVVDLLVRLALAKAFFALGLERPHRDEKTRCGDKLLLRAGIRAGLGA